MKEALLFLLIFAVIGFGAWQAGAHWTAWKWERIARAEFHIGFSAGARTAVESNRWLEAERMEAAPPAAPRAPQSPPAGIRAIGGPRA